MVYQLGGALLDACVLAVLDRGDAYGYSLTQNIKSVVEISESALYPVLRRLQSDECVTTYDMPYQGRNRRYYRITPKGREKIAQYKMQWQQYKAMVDSILGGEQFERT